MNEAIRIQLSTFVDGELPENESELLLRRLSQDAALRQQVGEYMQLGRLIRGEREVAGMSRLRARIAAALGEDAPEALPVDDVVPSRFFRPIAGIAVAASVAVAALVVLQQVGGVGGSDTGAANNEFAAVAIDDSSMYTEQPSSDFVSEGPSDRLAQYNLYHEEKAAGGSANFPTRLVTLTMELQEGKLVEIEPPDNDDQDNVDATDDSSSEVSEATGN